MRVFWGGSKKLMRTRRQDHKTAHQLNPLTPCPPAAQPPTKHTGVYTDWASYLSCSVGFQAPFLLFLDLYPRSPARGTQPSCFWKGCADCSDTATSTALSYVAFVSGVDPRVRELVTPCSRLVRPSSKARCWLVLTSAPTSQRQTTPFLRNQHAGHSCRHTGVI